MLRNALPGDFREVIIMLEQQRFPVDSAISSVVKLQKAPGVLASVGRESGALHENHGFPRLIPSEVERRFATVTELSSDNPHQSSHESPLLPRGYGVLFALVTLLFFLWGIPNSLNDVLIRQFMKSFSMTRFEAGLVQSAFHMGYFVLAMPRQPSLCESSATSPVF